MSERDDMVTDIMQHPWLLKGEFTGACPSCPDLTIEGGHNSPSHAGHIADALLAAGYRKPRTVTTVEELDALPQKTVVLDCDNDVWQKHRTTGLWSNAEGATQNSTLVAFYAPLTVLHEGAVDSEYHQHHGPQSTCNECEGAS